jgi:hypothetical protein
MSDLLLPKFLTRKIAGEAMRLAAQTAIATGHLKRETFHIILLVPGMKTEDHTFFPNFPIVPHMLAEYTHGDRKTWQRDYANIAQCKALQLWQGRNFGGTDSVSHLLIEGETPYRGGVKRDGIVVACSGVDSEDDQMISGISIDISIALAHKARLAWQAANPGIDFT